MITEYEIKVLNIEIEHIKDQLKNLWATYVNTKLFRRYVYDMVPAQDNKRIRLRTDWTKTTLTCKEIIDSQKIDWVKEREVVVDSFEMTHQLLIQMWYTAKAYQENKRESYQLNWCDIEIDHRPLIPPYLEIEWPNEERVRKTLSKLSIEWCTTTSENTTDVYKRYDIENLNEYSYLWFDKTVKYDG